MFRKLLFLTLLLLVSSTIFAQDHKTENIVLITLDGLRWQELFKGADPLFINDTDLIEKEGSLMKSFWDTDSLARRNMLFPFFWNTIATEGQIYGNRDYDNFVNNSNQMWFSYPGYNEILTGSADDKRINSNSKKDNPNITFLEYLNQIDAFKNRVYAFGSWDVFLFIINEKRSGVPVNAGFDKAEGDITAVEELINRMQDEIRGPWGGVRLDPFTHHFAMQTLKNKKPKVLYIAYGETDDWAHDNEYDQYIWSAHQTDKYIQEIWEYLQVDPQYKNKTTMIITTDHGRGITKKTWTGHGQDIPLSSQTWMMAIGPDTPAKGEMKIKGQWYPAMIARTVFELLGMEYPDAKAGKSIKEMTE